MQEIETARSRVAAIAGMTALILLVPASDGWLARAESGGCQTPAQLMDEDACWWATYLDPYFGATIDYPADLLRPEPAYAEGMGGRFVSRDGELALSVWGTWSTSTLTLRESMATDIYRSGFEAVTFQQVDEGGYLLGGRHGSRAFLKRVHQVRQGTTIVETACITWPADRDEEWRDLATRIVRSLRDGRGWARNPRTSTEETQGHVGSCSGL